MRFNGHPEVSQGGQLLYVFPSLQRTAKAKVRSCEMCRCGCLIMCVLWRALSACRKLQHVSMCAEAGNSTSKRRGFGAPLGLQQCIRGAALGCHCFRSGQLCGSLVSGQPAWLTRCQPDAGAELSRLHEWLVPLPSGLCPASSSHPFHAFFFHFLCFSSP